MALLRFERGLLSHLAGAAPLLSRSLLSFNDAKKKEGSLRRGYFSGGWVVGRGQRGMLSSLLSPPPPVVIAEDAEVTRLATLLAIARTENANDPVGGGLYGPLHPVNQVTADLAVFFYFFSVPMGFIPRQRCLPGAVGAVLLPYECH